MPLAANSEDIYITLGSPWVPADDIDDTVDRLKTAFRRVPQEGLQVKTPLILSLRVQISMVFLLKKSVFYSVRQYNQGTMLF